MMVMREYRDKMMKTANFHECARIEHGEGKGYRTYVTAKADHPVSAHGVCAPGRLDSGLALLLSESV
jgi:hypothetical protein